MEQAFLRFEVKVVELGNFEDVVNCVLMISHVGTSGDSDVVHVDSDGCTEWFVFENDVSVYVVHHGLEGRWRISESEVHDCRCEKSVSGFKCCFLLVSFTDANVVVPPSDV